MGCFLYVVAVIFTVANEGHGMYRLTNFENSVLQEICGKMESVETPKIFNGVPARHREIPWAISYFDKSREHPHCSATLISPYHFITSSHCVRRDLQNKTDISKDLSVLVGSTCVYNCTESDGLKPIEYEVKSVVVPKSALKQMEPHNELLQTWETDFAIGEVARPVELLPHVKPACVAVPYRRIEKRLQLYGFGHASKPPSNYGRLHSMTLTLAETGCIDSSERRPFVRFGCVPVFVAMLDRDVPLEQRQSVCGGDSGGGVVGVVNGRRTLFGVILGGDSYCDVEPVNETAKSENFMQQFGRVSHHHDLICSYTGVCPIASDVCLQKPERALNLGRTKPAEARCRLTTLGIWKDQWSVPLVETTGF